MTLDKPTRFKIAQALLQMAGASRGIRLIALPDDSVLEVEVRSPGGTKYSLIQGTDLLGDPVRIDVTEEVIDAMSSNVEWLRGLADSLDSPAIERYWGES